MKKTIKLTIRCMGVLACVSAFGYSNPIEGGSTETVTNNWNVPLPWLMVGSNSDSNSMVVTDGGQVVNQVGYLGNTVNSSGNSALIEGTGSSWNNSIELSVGHMGASNSLTVAGGGAVTAPNAYIGNLSDGNQITVTGADSLLNTTTLNVGYQGAGNNMSVSSGGTVESDTGTLGYWIGSDGNTAAVQSNGVWNNSSTLNIGDYGSGNQLNIADSGRVESSVINVGITSISSNNTVTVTGNDAVLDAPEIYIGGSASGTGGVGNRMEVDNGGTVATTDLTIYSGNNFDLNNGGTFAIDNDFNASMTGFNFNSGGTLEVIDGELTGMGSAIEDQRTVVMNGSNALWNKTGSTLYVGQNTSRNTMTTINGALIQSSSGYVGYAAGADDNRVSIAGLDSVWSNSSSLYIGRYGSGNTMMVSGGGAVNNRAGYIGYYESASNNAALVAGDDSVWSNSSSLYVGRYGAANSVTIADGGHAYNSTGYMGYYGSASNNVVEVTGEGSVWSNQSSLYMGYRGQGSALNVSDGGHVYNSTGYIGRNESSGNNMAAVEGEGSVWSNRSSLYVGVAGSDNTLTVSDGGTVYGHNAVLGNDADADRNAVVISGDHSALVAFDNLHVGNKGSFNHMVITDGGTALSEWGALGCYGSSSNNTAVVTGVGSTWSNAINLRIGYEGSGNQLMIEDGGHVYNDFSDIGFLQMSSNNSVLVTGLGTEWHNSEAVQVGYFGSSNYLEIADGGQVFSKRGNIGHHASSANNAALVSGAGSVWNVDVEMRVGWLGSGNRLSIEDGGELRSATALIGVATNSTGNKAEVTGEDARWDNEFLLAVGNYGSSNHMRVSDGGQVHNNTGRIGRYTGSDFNSVLISGEGSVWSNRMGLAVGLDGNENRLSIEDGGRVYSFEGRVGGLSNGWHNAALVTGSGSVWTNEKSMFVGRYGSHNQMTISDGGHVYNNLGNIGRFESSLNNSVLVSGAGSEWNNNYNLVLGTWGSHNTLEIMEGGFVGSSTGYVGRYEVATHNTAIISGPGSEWRNSHDLYIGEYGFNNAVIITNGGRVENMNGYIGYDAIASGNSATISGEGSVWDSSGQLHIGHDGSGNTLRIEDGGKVYAMNSAVGYGEGANGNRVVVTGEESIWGHGWTVPREGEVVFPIYEWPTRTNWPPVVISPPVDWPGLTNYPPIDWPGLTNNPIVIQPPYIEYPALTNDMPAIPGSGSFWSGGNPVVGSLTNNTLVITNGSSFAGGSGLAINFSNLVSISDGGFIGGSGGTILIPTNQLSAGGSGLWIGSSNVTLHGGTFAGGAVLVSNETSMATNSTFPLPMIAMRAFASIGDLAVGHGGSGNTLHIAHGGLVSSYHGMIGETSNAWNNAVSVSGAGSQWRNAGDLYIGGRMSQVSYLIDDEWFTPWVDGGRGNALTVADGGLVSVGGDMHNRNYSTVTLDDPDSRIVVDGNYYQDATSALRFGVETNALGTPLSAIVSVGDTAEFEASAQLQYHYDGDVGWMNFDTFFTNLIVEADRLVVGGVTNANALDLAVIKLDGSLVDLLLWEKNQDIYGLVGRRYLADSAGFTPGSQMARLAKEIDDMSLLGDPSAVLQINQLNRMSSMMQHDQLIQGYERGTPNYAHIQGMTEGLNELKKNTDRHQAGSQGGNSPSGAAGPHRPDQGWQGWVKPYGSWADYSADDGFSGYDHNIYGTIVGVDKPNDDVLLGMAGGYVRSIIKQDDGDRSEAKTGYGVLYASWGTEDWFGDFNVAYGQSDVKDRSGTSFGKKASYDASNYAFYFGGGKEMILNGSRFLFTPKASLLWSYYNQEEYTEKTAVVARQVDAYDHHSVLSSLGASLAFQQEYETMVVKPEARLNWLHEFNDDVEKADFSLLNGTGGRYHFYMPAALEDIVEAGLGISCRFHDEFELVFDVDGRWGDSYDAYSVSGRAIIEF